LSHTHACDDAHDHEKGVAARGGVHPGRPGCIIAVAVKNRSGDRDSDERSLFGAIFTGDSMSLQRRAGLIVGVAGLMFIAGVPVASARSAPAVPVPGHPIDTSLTLLAASAQGVVVQQGASASDPYRLLRVFSGAEGTELVRRPEVEMSVGDYTEHLVLGVVDGTLGWAKRRQGAGSAYYFAHRMNVRNGSDVLDGLMPQPLAFTGTSWLSDRIGSFANYPFPPPVLKRYQGTGAPADESTFMKSTDIMPDSGNTTQLTADGPDALQSSYELSDYSQDDGAPRYTLDLVDLAHGSKQTLVDAIPDVITSIALGPTTIAWATKATSGPLVIHQRPRAGGAVTTYTENDTHADAAHLAAGNGSAAYVVAAPGNPVMRIVGPTGAHDVALPEGSAGIAAVGNRYLTAAGGSAVTAGVYSVAAGAESATRVATVPSRTYPLSSLALTGSRLYYTDGSVTGHPGTTLWQRPVSGGKRPSFGAELPVSTTPAEVADLRQSSGISFSAGRGAVQTSHDGSWHLLDRGTQTGVIPGSTRAKVSGQYTLSAGKVYDPEGTAVYTEATPSSGTVVHDDLFGSEIVYSVRRDDGQDNEIWVDDVEHPAPKLFATEAPGPDCGGDAPAVTIWAATLAWDGCNGEGVTVANYVTGSRRTIYATSGRTYGLSVTLGDGVLAWQDSGTNVVDLTSPDSAPVTLPGTALQIVLDDHRIARQLYDPSHAGDWDLQVLPFTGKNRPRVIGTYAPLGFTPDGDGHADVWKPQFDVTKPLRSAELTICDLATGKTLRTLAGTAPDGSIRDLSWDGRDKKGVALAVGTYRWTLTAKADDGDGALLGARGEPAVQGTIEIDPKP
jgi:hypothetical protein